MHTFVFLRNLLAFALACVVSGAIGFIPGFVATAVGGQEAGVVIWGIVAFIALFYTYPYCKNILQDITKYVKGESINPKYFAIAEEEINKGEIADAGLWSKALVSAKVNEDMRSVEYMKLRARQLKNQNTNC